MRPADDQMDIQFIAYVRDVAVCPGSELLLKALEGKEHESVEVGEETAPEWLTGTPMLLVDDPGTGEKTALPPAQAFEYLQFSVPAMDAPIQETTATANAIDAAIEQRKKSIPSIPPNETSRLRG